MVGGFEARYSQQFLRDLKKLNLPLQQRILRAVETKLLTDPCKHGMKPAREARPGRWHFRVGDYRIRFDVEGSVLFFYRVRHRRAIYE